MRQAFPVRRYASSSPMVALVSTTIHLCWAQIVTQHLGSTHRDRSDTRPSRLLGAPWPALRSGRVMTKFGENYVIVRVKACGCMCRWNITLRREWHAIGDEVVPFERAAANFVRDRTGARYACACVIRPERQHPVTHRRHRRCSEGSELADVPWIGSTDVEPFQCTRVGQGVTPSVCT